MANCKVIAVTNQKGGVGKTTITANLGIGLAQENKRVLLIDADAQNSLTLSLGYPKPDDLPVTLTDIIQSVIDDKPIPDGHGILHHGEGVDLLPANITLSGMEIRLINAMNRERALRTYINEIKPHYDYILIDCMPSLGIMPLNSLAAADSVIIPSQPSFLSAKGLDLLMHSISQVKRQINPKLKIDGILFTMHNELRDTPKTGDDSNPTLWLSLLGISAVGAATLGVIGWKKKKTEKEDAE